jgi:hypothetical protein
LLLHFSSPVRLFGIKFLEALSDAGIAAGELLDQLDPAFR